MPNITLIPDIKIKLKKYLELWKEMQFGAEENRKRVKKSVEETPEPIEPEKLMLPSEAEKFTKLSILPIQKIQTSRQI